MPGSGFLAIWSDVETEKETDYLHWLTREHVPERVGIDGFRSGRVFRSVDPALHRYFILYELATPDVVSSEGYLARLNAPTPWSQRIMPTLGNFIRGGGQVSVSAGAGWGGVVAAVRIPDIEDGGPDMAALHDRVGGIAARDRIASVSLLEVDVRATTIRTREKAMREKDDSFRALLLIEGLDRAAVEAALAPAARQASDEHALFTAVFALRAGQAS